MNEIELYVVNYLLFASTRLSSAGNGHLKKRQPAVAFICSIVLRDTIKPNYPDQISKTYIVFLLCDFPNH